MRAVLVGCLLGALLAAGNVYTGLKTGYIDGGSITAAIVGFALFAAGKRGAQRPYSVDENNLTQTVASAAGMMAPTTGVISNIAALSLSGRHYPFWALMLWGIVLGALGIGIARTLRPRLIVSEELPFPTGRATAEVILAMHGARAAAVSRARILLLVLLGTAAITWLRDARGLLPQALSLPAGNAALSAAGLWLGAALSPMMLATGLLIGPRGGASVLVGSIGAWGILAPLLLSLKWVAKADYPALIGWLLWPGVGLLVSSALTSLALDWRGTLRALRDLRLWQNAPASAEALADNQLGRVWPVLLAASSLLVVILGRVVFGVNPLITLGSLIFSVVFASVSARAAGETDIAPASTGGAIAQVLFGATSLTTSLVSGGVVAGSAAQTAQMMWAFKTGHQLRTNRERQTLAQLLGVVVGAIVVVPVYDLVAGAYGIGTQLMPAPGALSWKATAEAVQLGSAATPNHAGLAVLVAAGLGVCLTLLDKTRAAALLPSPVALGIAFVIPAPLSGAIALGAFVRVLMRRRFATWSEENVPALAAGAIAGESLTGIVIAALLATGVLSG